MRKGQLGIARYLVGSFIMELGSGTTCRSIGGHKVLSISFTFHGYWICASSKGKVKVR